MRARKLISVQSGAVDVCITKVEKQMEFFYEAAAEQALMRNLILREDVEHIVTEAEQTGERLFDPNRSVTIAHGRMNTITIWVEYMADDALCRVVDLYCHRMTVEGERHG